MSGSQQKVTLVLKATDGISPELIALRNQFKKFSESSKDVKEVSSAIRGLSSSFVELRKVANKSLGNDIRDIANSINQIKSDGIKKATTEMSGLTQSIRKTGEEFKTLNGSIKTLGDQGSTNLNKLSVAVEKSNKNVKDISSSIEASKKKMDEYKKAIETLNKELEKLAKNQVGIKNVTGNARVPNGAVVNTGVGVTNTPTRGNTVNQSVQAEKDRKAEEKAAKAREKAIQKGIADNERAAKEQERQIKKQEADLKKANAAVERARREEEKAAVKAKVTNDKIIAAREKSDRETLKGIADNYNARRNSGVQFTGDALAKQARDTRISASKTELEAAKTEKRSAEENHKQAKKAEQERIREARLLRETSDRNQLNSIVRNYTARIQEQQRQAEAARPFNTVVPTRMNPGAFKPFNERQQRAAAQDRVSFMTDEAQIKSDMYKVRRSGSGPGTKLGQYNIFMEESINADRLEGTFRDKKKYKGRQEILDRSYASEDLNPSLNYVDKRDRNRTFATKQEQEEVKKLNMEHNASIKERQKVRVLEQQNAEDYRNLTNAQRGNEIIRKNKLKNERNGIKNPTIRDQYGSLDDRVAEGMANFQLNKTINKTRVNDLTNEKLINAGFLPRNDTFRSNETQNILNDAKKRNLTADREDEVFRIRKQLDGGRYVKGGITGSGAFTNMNAQTIGAKVFNTVTGKEREGLNITPFTLGMTAAAIGAVGVAAAFSKVITVGDQVALSISRIASGLNQVQGESSQERTQRAERMQSQIMVRSAQTGIDSNTYTDAFQRYMRAGQLGGRSSENMLDTTDTIVKANILSGQTTQEAQSSMIQLGQALSKGFLNGDEFRSISENAPVLLRAIREGIGVSEGELRRMSSAGQLTTERILNALDRASTGINQQFDELPMTMSRAGTQLTNSMSLLADEFNKLTSTSSGLAGAVSWFAGGITNAGVMIQNYRNRNAGGESGQQARANRRMEAAEDYYSSTPTLVARDNARRALGGRDIFDIQRDIDVQSRRRDEALAGSGTFEGISKERRDTIAEDLRISIEALDKSIRDWAGNQNNFEIQTGARRTVVSTLSALNGMSTINTATSARTAAQERADLEQGRVSSIGSRISQLPEELRARMSTVAMDRERGNTGESTRSNFGQNSQDIRRLEAILKTFNEGLASGQSRDALLGATNGLTGEQIQSFIDLLKRTGTNEDRQIYQMGNENEVARIRNQSGSVAARARDFSRPFTEINEPVPQDKLTQFVQGAREQIIIQLETELKTRAEAMEFETEISAALAQNNTELAARLRLQKQETDLLRQLGNGAEEQSAAVRSRLAEIQRAEATSRRDISINDTIRSNLNDARNGGLSDFEQRRNTIIQNAEQANPGANPLSPEKVMELENSLRAMIDATSRTANRQTGINNEFESRLTEARRYNQGVGVLNAEWINAYRRSIEANNTEAQARENANMRLRELNTQFQASLQNFISGLEDSATVSRATALRGELAGAIERNILAQQREAKRELTPEERSRITGATIQDAQASQDVNARRGDIDIQTQRAILNAQRMGDVFGEILAQAQRIRQEVLDRTGSPEQANQAANQEIQRRTMEVAGQSQRRLQPIELVRREVLAQFNSNERVLTGYLRAGEEGVRQAEVLLRATQEALRVAPEGTRDFARVREEFVRIAQAADAAKTALDWRRSADNTLRDLGQEVNLLGLVGQARERAEAIANKSREAQRAGLNLDQQTAAVREFAQAYDEVARARREAADDPLLGLRNSLDTYAASSRRLGEDLGNSLTNGIKAGEDAFAEFAKTGRFSLKNLTDSIISDFARIAFRRTMGNTIRALSGEDTGPNGEGNTGLLGGPIASLSRATGLSGLFQSNRDQYAAQGAQTGRNFQALTDAGNRSIRDQLTLAASNITANQVTIQGVSVTDANGNSITLRRPDANDVPTDGNIGNSRRSSNARTNNANPATSETEIRNNAAQEFSGGVVRPVRTSGTWSSDFRLTGVGEGQLGPAAGRAAGNDTEFTRLVRSVASQRMPNNPEFSEFAARIALQESNGIHNRRDGSITMGPQTRYGQAVGGMQVLRTTGASMGFNNLEDPNQNARAGVEYLTRNFERTRDYQQTAIAYNAGPGRIRGAIDGRGIPTETHNYVANVAPGRGVRDGVQSSAPVETIDIQNQIRSSADGLRNSVTDASQAITTSGQTLSTTTTTISTESATLSNGFATVSNDFNTQSQALSQASQGVRTASQEFANSTIEGANTVRNSNNTAGGSTGGTAGIAGITGAAGGGSMQRLGSGLIGQASQFAGPYSGIVNLLGNGLLNSVTGPSTTNTGVGATVPASGISEMSNIFTGLTDRMGGLFDGFSGTFGNLISGLGSSLGSIFSGIAGGLGGGGGSSGGGLGSIFGLIGSVAGMSGGGGASVMAGVFHRGGEVGGMSSQRSVSSQIFNGANRYHTGGIAGRNPLKKGEIPAILQEGEHILTKSQMARISSPGRFDIGSPVAGTNTNSTTNNSSSQTNIDRSYAPNVTINVNGGSGGNMDGFRRSASQNASMMVSELERKSRSNG